MASKSHGVDVLQPGRANLDAQIIYPFRIKHTDTNQSRSKCVYVSPSAPKIPKSTPMSRPKVTFRFATPVSPQNHITSGVCYFLQNPPFNHRNIPALLFPQPLIRLKNPLLRR